MSRQRRGLTNERARRYFDKHAADYDRKIGWFERHVLGQHREWATGQATGRVLELAVGTGLNLPLYPLPVRHIVGVELSEQMLAIARTRVEASGLDGRVELQHGDAQDLDVADESFDTVLSTYTLCTIPDPRMALDEAWRALVPGGRLVLVEHGAATGRAVRAVQRVLNPISVRMTADDMLRDFAPMVVETGFEIVESDRSGFAGTVTRIVATKPDAAA